MFTMRHTVRASNAAARAILLHCAAPLAKDDIDLYSYQDMANVYLHAYLTKIYVSDGSLYLDIKANIVKTKDSRDRASEWR